MREELEYLAFQDDMRKKIFDKLTGERVRMRGSKQFQDLKEGLITDAENWYKKIDADDQKMCEHFMNVLVNDINMF